MAKPQYKDPKGRSVRVYVNLLNSPAYRVIGYAAKTLFFDLRERINGSNNGNVNAALSELKHKGWKAPATLSKALYELRVMGFLSVTRAGGLKLGTRVCTLYRFTDLDVFEHPKLGIPAIQATHDYLQFNSVAESERALIVGVKKLQAEGSKKQATRKPPPVQNPYRIATENVPIAPNIATESVQGDDLSLQNLYGENSH